MLWSHTDCPTTKFSTIFMREGSEAEALGMYIYAVQVALPSVEPDNTTSFAWKQQISRGKRYPTKWIVGVVVEFHVLAQSGERRRNPTATYGSAEIFPRELPIHKREEPLQAST